jgi:uncharacterized protein YbjT (DUF2867 family)
MTTAGGAFVAGATGYTGRFLVAALRTQGVPAVAHVRSDSPRLAEWHAHFSSLGATVDATPWQAEPLQVSLARLQPRFVFALLGTTRKRTQREAARGRDSSYQAVDYGLSRMLLHATQSACPAARFVYLSSLGVSATARNEYLAVRWKLEQELHASGLDYVIARPSFITGTDREEVRPLERISARVVDSVLWVVAALGGGAWSDLYGSITGSALGRALVAAALTPACGRRTLDTRALRRLVE